jgi:hypothetical protein
MASDATTRTKSTADTVAFLQRHLGPLSKEGAMIRKF